MLGYLFAIRLVQTGASSGVRRVVYLSLEGPPLFAVRACPDVLQPHAPKSHTWLHARLLRTGHSMLCPYKAAHRIFASHLASWRHHAELQHAGPAVLDFPR